MSRSPSRRSRGDNPYCDREPSTIDIYDIANRGKYFEVGKGLKDKMREYRDSKILDIFEGTAQIQRLGIARQLLGRAAG